ncbi:MAG: Mor transcription activator family protein [Romboutsia sp.]|uniref:Mor transcription activator family protein n=1 Tax=Romboutsia sp. TaxID=1965302 RepID=UPI003F2A49AD
MDLKIGDLPEHFEYVANKIGLDNLNILIKEFGGMSVYFPTEKMLYKEARDRNIINEFNGFNYKELADRYNISVSYTRSIISKNKKKYLNKDKGLL